MKNKVICPNCGFVYDIKDFLELLNEHDEDATEITCSRCLETNHITWKSISYQSYSIDLQTSNDSVKDFVVETYNKHDENKLSVEFKVYKWFKIKEFDKEPSQNEFKEVVKGLKKELVELAEEYYNYNLKNIQRIGKKLK